ncbi:hypothetical protein Rumeso_00098 [Rubellimicrobium mesophilum DSM 19309]|uniref:Coenzyme Q-binding protein COQ10 START domain-containing protein n=1 Tax=Rubellimicrobium mesophilum DSM 19309 TaxID=442562 RepID=A0A017HWY8_9RHOB|nr:SRPBCC family protein [Rubellimicrobium mesophilum]EYD78269.1 hypothetical protein Rumeso_00098 [Rubellimicrobium mesophilum DSM 19309]
MDQDRSDWLHQPRPTWPPESRDPISSDPGFSAVNRRIDEHLSQGRVSRLTDQLTEHKAVAAATVLGLGALAGLAAYSLMGPSQPQVQRHAEIPRLPDDAPGRTAKQARFGDYAVAGRSVTIDRPRQAIFEFWRDFRNLSKFMENIEDVREVSPGVTAWTIRAPLGMTMQVTSRIVNEKPGEQIAWRSTEDSQIETEGKVSFRDAPGGRGTIVEAHVAYRPPMGALGQMVAKVFSAEPSIQSRRDLKRLKMLLETGEIATNKNQRGEGGKFQKAVERDIQNNIAAV